jgi:hypothetical protein
MRTLHVHVGKVSIGEPKLLNENALKGTALTSW